MKQKLVISCPSTSRSGYGDHARDLIRSYLGNYDTLLANTRAQVTITVEMAGSGSAGTAPHYSPLFTSCGMAETVVSSTSVTYAPVSSKWYVMYNTNNIIFCTFWYLFG